MTTWKPALVGIHVREWLCELAGTGLLVAGGLSAVVFINAPSLPVVRLLPNPSPRLLLIGILFGGVGSLIAISPLGRWSGAHLNPAVTIGFWLTGHVHRRDLAGYIVSQLLGAVVGAALVALVWGHVAATVSYGRTLPAPGLPPLAAVAIETLMTAALGLVIFGCVAHPRTAPWTPLAVWVTVALLVWQGATFTGTSLNPARSLGPALVARDLGVYWIYVAGPLLGAIAAALLVRFVLPFEPLTAKLFHHPADRSIFKTALPDAR